MSEKFVPYIPPEENIPELTAKALLLGIILALIMTAANAYLGLYVGMTVSASIPAAVISMAVFRSLLKANVINDATILENNLTKTMASAGESLAAGVIFTLPALLVMGAWTEIKYMETMVIALIGGIMGVLFTITLRKILIVELDLPYPEGVACTEVLIVGEEGGKGTFYVFSALAMSMLYKLVSSHNGLRLWEERVNKVFIMGKARLYGGADLSVALLGVGFIVGPLIASYVFIGGVIGWVIIAPVVGFIYGWPEGNYVDAFMIVWSNYVRYVGVGAMIVGGAYTLFKMRDAILTGVKQGLMAKEESEEEVIRTEHDLKRPFLYVAILLIPMCLLYYHLSESIMIAVVATLIMGIAAFFFTAIAGYIAGVVGSSNNPISGVTVATLLFAAIIVAALDSWGFGVDIQTNMAATIAIAAVVCCSAAIAGDVMQDLKTGQLLGSTPRNLQIGEFIGVICAAIVIGPVLHVLHEAYVIGSPDLRAPQAGLMAAVTQGVFLGTMNWTMVFLGMAIAGILIWQKIPVMSVAIGVYLPFTLSIPIMMGGLIKLGTDKFVEKKIEMDEEEGYYYEDEDKDSIKKEVHGRGILFSSGLIAGEALMGVLVAVFVIQEIDLGINDHPIALPGMLIFGYIMILLAYMAVREFIEDLSWEEIKWIIKDSFSDITKIFKR